MWMLQSPWRVMWNTYIIVFPWNAIAFARNNIMLSQYYSLCYLQFSHGYHGTGDVVCVCEEKIVRKESCTNLAQNKVVVSRHLILCSHRDHCLVAGSLGLVGTSWSLPCDWPPGIGWDLVVAALWLAPWDWMGPRGRCLVVGPLGLVGTSWSLPCGGVPGIGWNLVVAALWLDPWDWLGPRGRCLVAGPLGLVGTSWSLPCGWTPGIG